MQILLRFNEVALKGSNRGWFEKTLGNNAKLLVARQSKLDPRSIRYRWVGSRLTLDAPWNEKTRASLEKTFGVTGYSPIHSCSSDAATIESEAVQLFRNYVAEFGLPASFRIKCRRPEKVIPQKSQDLERAIGTIIGNEFPDLVVDLKNPAMILGIEVRKLASLLWCHRYKGPGGLPVGSNSPVLTLLSGGLDSPIAALRMMKRGSHSHFIYFHGEPFVGNEVLEKVKDLAALLSQYSPARCHLYVIPFGKIQEQIALNSLSKARTLLYRRMMIRIAEALARKIGALALVTGESLGQVASQTLENLSVIDAVAELPILRPLVGMDKDEIITEARRFQTFDISNRPGDDCCTLFADRHPLLKASRAQLEELEAQLPFSLEELTQQALKSAQRVDSHP